MTATQELVPGVKLSTEEARKVAKALSDETGHDCVVHKKVDPLKGMTEADKARFVMINSNRISTLAGLPLVG